MNVGFRRVSPLKLAGIGGVAILALIGIGLHPPTGHFESRAPAPALTGGDVTVAPIPVSDDGAVPAEQASRESTRRPGPTASPGSKNEGGKSGSGTQGGSGSAGGGSAGSGSAGGGSGGGGGAAGGGASTNGVSTVNCPSVQDHLPAIPAAAAAEVNSNLALLKQQIAEANARLAELAANPVDDPNFIQNTILGPLRDNRIATIDRITIAIGRYTTPPADLNELAPCRLSG